MIKTHRKAKSVRIAEKLKQELFEKPPVPGSRAASAAELAAHYNISVPTAHNVLNLLEQEGLLYRKHGSGTFFALEKKLTIGILDQPVGAILPQEINAVLNQFCEHALMYLEQKNIQSRVISYPELSKPDIFAGLDGLLVSRLFIDPRSLQQLRQSRLPFVVYRCSTMESKNFSCCEFNVKTGIHEALQYLKPDKNSPLFLFSETTFDSKWLEKVYLNELAAQGLSILEQYSFSPLETAVECFRIIRVQAEKFRNSIIFCTNDVLAINLYNALLLEGMFPGRDFRLIGIDNTEGYNANIHNPPVISSIHKPINTMSAEALNLLLRMIREPSVNDTVIRIPTSFVPRKSAEPFLQN